MKKTANKIKTFFVDHLHILFCGAPENHLRIEHYRKSLTGPYELSVTFSSYTQLKRYQKRLRRLVASFSGVIAMFLLIANVAPNFKTFF